MARNYQKILYVFANNERKSGLIGSKSWFKEK